MMFLIVLMSQVTFMSYHVKALYHSQKMLIFPKFTGPTIVSTH
jgi:hypothetical protein